MKKSSKKKLTNYKKYKLTIFVASFFILLVAALLIYRYYRVNEIKDHQGITIGRITGAQNLYKPPAYDLKYSYQVDNKDFQNVSSGTSVKSYNVKYFLWKDFPVIYSIRKPEIASILILPTDFEMWDIPFPDSLSWVIPYEKY